MFVLSLKHLLTDESLNIVPKVFSVIRERLLKVVPVEKLKMQVAYDYDRIGKKNRYNFK